MPMPILAPAAILVAWSIVMLLWAVAVRMPALKNAKIPKNRTVGGRGSDLDGILPRETQWKAHNYNHLMEQPTIFYATAFALQLLSITDQNTITLAWAYVGLRVVHSFVQATVNIILVRFSIFVAASVVLGFLIYRAALGVGLLQFSF